MRQALIPVALALCLGSCGEPVRDDHFANDVQAERAEPEAVQPGAVAVRVGEHGPALPACGAAGTTRRLPEGESLPVYEAPFDNARQTGAIAPESRFFVCARSHDQRWLGVVYDRSGSLSPACRVSSPLPSRRSYAGPCPSGWVSSVHVRLVAG